MTDGYAPYDDISSHCELVHLGCWAHARRYLIEAEEALPKAKRAEHPVAKFIERIGLLFSVEAQAKDMTATLRRVLRAERSRPILDELEGLLLHHLHTVLPTSLFGKALHYLHSQWPKLTRYVENAA